MNLSLAYGEFDNLFVLVFLAEMFVRVDFTYPFHKLASIFGYFSPYFSEYFPFIVGDKALFDRLGVKSCRDYSLMFYSSVDLSILVSYDPLSLSKLTCTALSHFWMKPSIDLSL